MRPIAPKAYCIFGARRGVGFSPYFRGTLGTLVAVSVSLAVNRLAANGPTLGLFMLLGLADGEARILAKKDAPAVVIDEFAGFALAKFLSNSMTGLILAFVLFRFFDIAEVFPAAHLEAPPGRAGVVLDDIMAGLYTFFSLRLIAHASLA